MPAGPKSIDTSKARVLVVGDVMLDRYWFGDVSRISPEAPVPVVLVKNEDARLGGAANVAWNCRELGARTRLLSVVGRDEPDLQGERDREPPLLHQRQHAPDGLRRALARQCVLHLREAHEPRRGEDAIAAVDPRARAGQAGHRAVERRDEAGQRTAGEAERVEGSPIAHRR